MVTNLFAGIFRTHPDSDYIRDWHATPSGGTSRRFPIADPITYQIVSNGWDDFDRTYAQKGADRLQPYTVASSIDNSIYGIWGPYPGGAITRTTDLEKFVADFQKRQAEGMTLADMEFRTTQNETWYFGCWVKSTKSSPRQALEVGLDWQQLVKLDNTTEPIVAIVNLQSYQSERGQRWAVVLSVSDMSDTRRAFSSTYDWNGFITTAQLSMNTVPVIDFQVDDESSGRRAYRCASMALQKGEQAEFLYDLEWSDFTKQAWDLAGKGFMLKRLRTYSKLT